MKFSYDTMIKAVQENDSIYNGEFYAGVMTTGIYCLPSCKARLPKLKNIKFYQTREEAIAAGLRGCKRCKSELYPDVLPEWLPRVIDYMKSNRSEKLNENRLMEMTKVNISTVRRYFKDNLDITPMAFHRTLRLEHAKTLIDSGEDFFTAAHESGYESLSGFQEAYLNHFGHTYNKENTDG